MKIINEQTSPLKESVDFGKLKKALITARREHKEVDQQLGAALKANKERDIDWLSMREEALSSKIGAYEDAIRIFKKNDPDEVAKFKAAMKKDFEQIQRIGAGGDAMTSAIKDAIITISTAIGGGLGGYNSEWDGDDIRFEESAPIKENIEVNESVKMKYPDFWANHGLNGQFDELNQDLKEFGYPDKVKDGWGFPEQAEEPPYAIIVTDRGNWFNAEYIPSRYAFALRSELTEDEAKEMAEGLNKGFESDDIEESAPIQESVEDFDGVTHANVQRVNLIPGIRDYCPHCDRGFEEYPPEYWVDPEHTVACQGCQEPLGNWEGTVQGYGDDGQLFDLDETKKVREELTTEGTNDLKRMSDDELFAYLDQVRQMEKSKETQKLQGQIEMELSSRQLDF